MIEVVDANWQGALPYTLLADQGGKIVCGKQDLFDPAKIRKTIVDNPLPGRYY